MGEAIEKRSRRNTSEEHLISDNFLCGLCVKKINAKYAKKYSTKVAVKTTTNCELLN